MANSGLERSISSAPGRRIALLLPLVLIIDLLVVVALGLMPLESIGGLRCDAVLEGGGAKPNALLPGMIAASKDRLCSDASSGRTVVMIGVGLLVLLLGTGAVLAPADRLERFLVRRGDDADDGDGQWEEARRLDAARQDRLREERSLGDARRHAQARAEEERVKAVQERRAERVARARAARRQARSGAPTTKKVTKAAKSSRQVKAGQANKASKARRVTKAVKATQATKATQAPRTPRTTKAPGVAKAAGVAKVAKSARAVGTTSTRVATKARTASKAPRATKAARATQTAEAVPGVAEAVPEVIPTVTDVDTHVIPAAPAPEPTGSDSQDDDSVAPSTVGTVRNARAASTRAKVGTRSARRAPTNPPPTVEVAAPATGD